MTFKKNKKISHVIFWTVISAAFIGPGTVTTALRTGSLFQTELLWTVMFSVIACYVLQEASSRITIATGRPVGKVVAEKFSSFRYLKIDHMLIYLIIFGCAAYQAGNLVGAIEGIQLLMDIDRRIILVAICSIAGFILWTNRIKIITRILGILVFAMVLLFILLALQTEFSISKIITHTVIPRFPANSSLYIIAMVGTTIVPYNIFLGSGLSLNRDLSGTRFGLANAIAIGGLITLLIVLSGSLITATFTFENISSVLENKLGSLGKTGFTAGLFAAGFTSSITAPLAAAVTGQSLFLSERITETGKKRYFRMTWLGVLITGAAFGFINYEPVLLIIIAQAINGLILPFLAVSLFIVISDPSIISKEYSNSQWYSILMFLITGITVFLGFFHFFSVINRIFELDSSYPLQILVTGILTFFTLLWMVYYILEKKKS